MTPDETVDVGQAIGDAGAGVAVHGAPVGNQRAATGDTGEAEPEPPAGEEIALLAGRATPGGHAREAGVREAHAAVDERVKAIVEALIFASPEPITPRLLFKLLENEPKEDVEAALASIKSDYARKGGLQLVEVAGGYQIVTRPELHEWVRRLFHERKTQKLSAQALETLAVIAYKQPITAPEIAEIRGVNTTGVLSTLLERRLIKIAGRKQVVGRPFLYATTREFLIRFGLRDLSDLPRMEDMSQVLGFDVPIGLADSEPVPGTLPLEIDMAGAEERTEQGGLSKED
ncbi:MAG: SMC-Scp complex subunit ScpB [Vicinamibacterales bacterium]